MTDLSNTTGGRFRRLRLWFGSLSFRTGVIVAAVCVLCYVAAFAQMALPTGAGVKFALWAAFYGLAKASQYAAIFILGKEGIARLRRFFAPKKA